MQNKVVQGFSPPPAHLTDCWNPCPKLESCPCPCSCSCRDLECGGLPPLWERRLAAVQVASGTNLLPRNQASAAAWRSFGHLSARRRSSKQASPLQSGGKPPHSKMRVIG